MITSRHGLLAGLCAAGFLAGFLGKRFLETPRPGGGNTAVARRSAAPETIGSHSSAELKPGPPAAPSLRSKDTLETLAALDDEALYGRLALWLLDASGEDIATFWKNYSTRKGDWEIQRLIFIQWSLRDPQAALAALAGTSFEGRFWQAWAGQDPQAALAAALGKNEAALKSVAFGIGTSQPDWLRAHFGELPAAAQKSALDGLAASEDAGNPLETLNFLKAHPASSDLEFNTNLLKALIAKDPWSAYDWVNQNGHMLAQRYGNESPAMDMFVRELNASQPDVLQRMADLAPSGAFKRSMEAALFKNLLEADPEAALEQAKATKAPAIAKERLAAVGLAIARTDPDKAFEIAQSLFAACPNPFRSEIRVEFENNGSSWGSGSQTDVQSFLNALVAKDPAKLLEMCLPAAAGSNPGNFTYPRVASMWAQRDLVSYTGWVNQQTDPQIHDRCGGIIANQLFQEGQCAEALDWAASLGKEQYTLESYYRNWQRTSPEDAAQWLDSSNLPEDRKAKLRNNGQR